MWWLIIVLTTLWANILYLMDNMEFIYYDSIKNGIIMAEF